MNSGLDAYKYEDNKPNCGVCSKSYFCLDSRKSLSNICRDYCPRIQELDLNLYNINKPNSCCFSCVLDPYCIDPRKAMSFACNHYSAVTKIPGFMNP